MLRSLHRRLRTRLVVALCPTQVAIVERRRGWRARLNCLAVIPFTSVPGEPDWQAPLAALRDWLEQNKCSRMNIEVVLSDRFARYAVIPWSDEVQGSEIEILSRIRFESLYGDAVAQWQIQADCDTYGKAGIGCALDSAFLSALKELCAANKLRLISLQPYFVRAFNRWRSWIGKTDALFVVVEPDYCVLACAKKEGWHSVRGFRLRKNGTDELTVLIQREIMLQGLDEQSAIMLNYVEPNSSAPIMPNVDVTLLELPPPSETRPEALSMALCGAI